jgi:hypothetical protein
MTYLLVFVVAVAAGIAVYVSTVRSGPAELQGFGPETGPSMGEQPISEPGGAYIPVTGGRPDWASRLTGFFGLAVAIVVGSAALATAIVIGWSLLSSLIGGN